MKQKLLKTVLVALALVTGSMGMKAEDIIYNAVLINQDYSDVSNESDNWTGGADVAQTLRSGNDYYYTITYAGNSSSSSKDYTLPDLSSYSAYKLTFLWGMYSCSATNRQSSFSIVGPSSDIVTTGNVKGQSSTATINGSNLGIVAYSKSDRGNANRINILYKFELEGINTGDNTGVFLTIYDEQGSVVSSRTRLSDYQIAKTLHFVCGQYFGQFAVDDMKLEVYTEKPIAPEASLTAVNMEKRKIEMSQINNNEIYYYTTGSDYSIEGLTPNKYENPIEISEDTYFVMYAQSGDSKSDYSNFYAEAGTVVPLSQSSVSLNEGYKVYNGVLSNPSFTIYAPNNSGVLLSPSTEKLEYSFTPLDGVESDRVEITSGYVFQPSLNGTLKVYASTTGYGESVFSIPVSAKYTPNFTYNYDQETADGLSGWSDVSSDWWAGATAYRSTATNSTTLGRLRFGNNTVTDVVIGWGVGRAGNNCSLKLRNFKLGEINILDIHTSTDGSDRNPVISKTIFATYGSGKDADISGEFYVTKLNTVKCLKVYAPVEATDLATVTSVGFATYSPSSNVSVPDDVKIYTVTVDAGGNSVTLHPVDAGSVVEAGTGYVIEAAEGSYPFAVSNEAVSSIGENALTVSDGAVTVGESDNIYVLAQRSDGNVGFLKVASGVEIPAGKAYLELSESQAKASFLSFGNIVTAIESTESTAKAGNGVYYSLQGIRTSAPAKGLYVINGKKVVVK